MSKTIDEQLERLASAQERTAEAQERSATALEGILKAIASATVSVRVTETNEDAGTDDEPATEEATVEETQAEVVEEEPAPKAAKAASGGRPTPVSMPRKKGGAA